MDSGAPENTFFDRKFHQSQGRIRMVRMSRMLWPLRWNILCNTVLSRGFEAGVTRKDRDGHKSSSQAQARAKDPA